MSKTLYVVFAEGGEYEESYSTPLHGWTDKANADKHAAELADKLVKLNFAIEKMHEFQRKYGAEYPRPVMDTSVLKSDVKGPSKMQSKAAMGEQAWEKMLADLREQRNAVREYNHTFYAAHEARDREWSEGRDIYTREYLKNIGVEESVINTVFESWLRYTKEVNYVVRELEVD